LQNGQRNKRWSLTLIKVRGVLDWDFERLF
jgi:hypothetical protein